MKNSPIFKELTWNPKSGLSLTELAFCLPYIFNELFVTDLDFFDKNETFFRHFDIKDHYEPIKGWNITNSYDPREKEESYYDEGYFYKWKPKSDASVYELALAIPLICQPHAFSQKEDPQNSFLRHFEITYLPIKDQRLSLTPIEGYGFEESHTFFYWKPKSDITLDELVASIPFINSGPKPTKEVDIKAPFLKHFELREHEANINRSDLSADF